MYKRELDASEDGGVPGPWYPSQDQHRQRVLQPRGLVLRSHGKRTGFGMVDRLRTPNVSTMSGRIRCQIPPVAWRWHRGRPLQMLPVSSLEDEWPILSRIVAIPHPGAEVITRDRATAYAQAAREQALGPDHPDTAISLNNLAGLLHAQEGRYEEAEPLYRRALAIWETKLGPEHPHTVTCRANLTALLSRPG